MSSGPLAEQHILTLEGIIVFLQIPRCDVSCDDVMSVHERSWSIVLCEHSVAGDNQQYQNAKLVSCLITVTPVDNMKSCMSLHHG